MLSSNAESFTPDVLRESPQTYMALRLMAQLLSVVAILIMLGGGFIAVIVILASLGSAGVAARLAQGPVAAGLLGAGLLGGLLILLATGIQALLFWAFAQGIRLLLSIEGYTRQAAETQWRMLAELRRIAASSTPPASRQS